MFRDHDFRIRRDRIDQGRIGNPKIVYFDPLNLKNY